MHQPSPALSALQPPLLIDAAVQPLLRALARQSMARAPDVAQRLPDEIDRAERLPADQLPRDADTLGSYVTYQDAASGAIRTVQRVHPTQADAAALRIAVIRPIGAALIGLRPGQSIHWEVQDPPRTLTVLRVADAL